MEGAGLAASLAIAIAALVVAVTAAVLLVRARRLSPSDALGGARQADFERRLAQLGHRLAVLEEDFDSRRGGESSRVRPPATAGARADAAGARVGLVRFDAFEDTGGGHSFALAFIDDEGDGVVLTSLHSRQASRLYVKDVRGGVADAPLSQEEERALRAAGLVA